MTKYFLGSNKAKILVVEKEDYRFEKIMEIIMNVFKTKVGTDRINNIVDLEDNLKICHDLKLILIYENNFTQDESVPQVLWDIEEIFKSQKDKPTICLLSPFYDWRRMVDDHRHKYSGRIITKPLYDLEPALLSMLGESVKSVLLMSDSS